MNDTDSSNPDTSSAEMLPMGAVTRRTGISEHTLRAWERRFGFPKPLRLSSGHRRYTNDQVQRLLLITKALRSGYRAGDVVPLPQERIEALIRESLDSDSGLQANVQSRHWVEEILHDAAAFDEAAIRAMMSSDSASMGVRRFLRERAMPLLEELGEAWARGDIGVRHEHFVSEILDDHLRGLRRPFEDSGAGRPVVLACLENELHGLGLQMVAAEIAAAGQNTVVLGPHTPLEEIATTARALEASAVGISVSHFAPPDETEEMIATLHEHLPPGTQLWIGGRGAASLDSLPKGTRRFDSLDDVAQAARKLSV